MKGINQIVPVLLLVLCCAGQTSGVAQAIDPQRSAQAAANNDTRFIADNIQYNQDEMVLLQRALDRSKNPRILELAQQMIEDHTATLYSFQELSSAGSGSAGQQSSVNDAHTQASTLDGRLAGAGGIIFDTIWVSNMLARDQAKFDELTLAKTTVTNPQLKTAVSEALALVRKHRTQLNILQKEIIKMATQKRKPASAR